MDMDLLPLRSLRRSHSVRRCCASFRHSAGFHARVVLDSDASSTKRSWRGWWCTGCSWSRSCRGRRKSEWGRRCARVHGTWESNKRWDMCGPDGRFFSGAQRWRCNSWAVLVRSALVNRLQCAACAVWVGVLSTHRRFSGILSRKPTSPPFLRWCRLPRTPTRLPLRSQPLWSWKWRWRCCRRVFAWLSVVPPSSFPIDTIIEVFSSVVDVLDVSVSEVVAFPPGEHLAFQGIVSMQRQMLVVVEEAFEAHQMFDVLHPLSSRSCTVVSFKSDAFEKQSFLFANIVLCRRIKVSFFYIPSCENRWMVPVFWLCCFLKHLLYLDERDVSLRFAVLWSSSRILLDDKARLKCSRHEPSGLL